MRHPAKHFAADFFLRDKPDIDQATQMESECGGRHAESGLNLPDIQAAGSGTNQQPVDIEPRQVAQLRQATCGKSAVHVSQTRYQRKKL